jgi:hypothetical protein
MKFQHMWATAICLSRKKFSENRVRFARSCAHARSPVYYDVGGREAESGCGRANQEREVGMAPSKFRIARNPGTTSIGRRSGSRLREADLPPRGLPGRRLRRFANLSAAGVEYQTRTGFSLASQRDARIDSDGAARR